MGVTTSVNDTRPLQRVLVYEKEFPSLTITSRSPDRDTKAGGQGVGIVEVYGPGHGTTRHR